jgi:WXG100 family type VII secretion target
MTGPGSGYETNVATMQQAAQHVDQVNQQIQGQLSSLLSKLEPLQGAWQSSAATSFQNLKQRWHDDATKLNQALQGIGEALKRSGQSYQATDDTHKQAFDQAQTNLS